VGTLAVRPAERGDAGAIKALALDNHMFEPADMGVFDEMLGGYYSGELAEHRWIVATDGGRVVGAAYVAPEPFADRMWNLYFIAAAPDRRGTGVGAELIRSVEASLRGLGEDAARTLIVDTSSLEGYQGARAFYRRHGFVEEARIRDFYGPGDNKVTFRKALTGDDPAGG
jgi:ribosomal protein S18 acetylase RimI-like enzyme